MGFDDLVTVNGGVDGRRTHRSSGRGAISLVGLRIRQRIWRQCVLLLVAVALTLGVVRAVLLGAARSVTTMDRLREETPSSDLLWAAATRSEVSSTRWRRSGGARRVRSGGGRELFAKPKESQLVTGYNLGSFAPYPFPGGATVDVPVIVEGRAPDQAKVDEVLMNRALADGLGLRVGDRVVLESQSFE